MQIESRFYLPKEIIWKKQRIRIYDIENLPFGINITLHCKDGHEFRGIVFGNRIGFENGNYMEMSDVEDREIYLGWK